MQLIGRRVGAFAPIGRLVVCVCLRTIKIIKVRAAALPPSRRSCQIRLAQVFAEETLVGTQLHARKIVTKQIKPI